MLCLSHLRFGCAFRVVAIILSAVVTAASSPAEEPASHRTSLLSDFVAREGAFLDEVDNQRQLATEILQATAARQISAARATCGSDPDAAIALLKDALAAVEMASDASADVRAQLRNQLVAAIKDCQRQQMEKQRSDQLAASRQAAAREQQRLLTDHARREEQIEQILTRYNALLNEWRYREAEEAAMQSRELAPDHPTPTAATLTARTAGYVHDNASVREARQRAIVDALFRVEQAHVPFADEPPITFPHAQVWEELTLRRQKYAAMSLDKPGSAEERIFSALQEPTTLEFIEMPLRDVMDYIGDLHDIEVEINYRALEEVGLGADTTITRNLKGISLRSALRLVLRELDLTYAVRDEVLLITTPEEVENDLAVKVYPVADLVLPISSGGGANPFQMGAGLGNQGAFGGGISGGAFGNQMNGGYIGGPFGNFPDPAGPVF